MAILDMNGFSPAIQHYYDDEQVANEAYKLNPALAMIPKWTEWTGDSFNEALIYEDITGGSINFATAQANAGIVATQQFAITTVTDYQLAQIKNEVLLATRNSATAFLDAAKTTIDSALRANGKSLGGALFLDGTGVVGAIGVIAGQVLTLTDITQIVNFQNGGLYDVVIAGTSTVRGTVTLNAVNRNLGTITTVAALPGGTIVTDQLCRSGDVIASLAGKVAGFAAWLPLTRPVSATPFFGVNRAVDELRLAGSYFDGRGIPANEMLTQALDFAYREGAMTDVVFCGYQFWSQLKNLLGTKVEYSTAEAFDNPQISFKSISVAGPSGEVKIVQDRQCPKNVAYALQLDTWKIRSRGRAPMIINYEMEGLEARGIYNQDGIELRIGYYGNVACNAPGRNMVMQLL